MGIHDNFFELGGRSFAGYATRLTCARRILGSELRACADSKHPTVEGLAGEIEHLRGLGREQAITPVARDADGTRPQALPLSFAQQRLWFLDQLEPQGSFYNIPSALRLRGPLDYGALVWSLNEMARRHEVLRTAFVNQDGVPAQVIFPSTALDIPVEDLTALLFFVSYFIVLDICGKWSLKVRLQNTLK